mmetsp:Transcript_119954/g.245278  ORF Transcript_119954/g.245278 Transcript_119954/m.245278 type:complete len:541 (+) Transcript_119954:273-1895(+)
MKRTPHLGLHTMTAPQHTHRRHSAFLLLCILVHASHLSSSVVTCFSSNSVGDRRSSHQRTTRAAVVRENSVRLFSSVEDKQQQTTSAEEEYDDDDETPAGIGGAEFFGGNKQKEELYDPVAELEAGKDIQLKSTKFARFSESAGGAFDTPEVATMAKSLQRQINRVLYQDDKTLKEATERHREEEEDAPENETGNASVSFDGSLSWETPMTTSSSNLIDELKTAKAFYEEIDVAIVGGKKVSENVVEFFWEVSVVWPTFWSPRVALAGTSSCTVVASSGETATTTITKQVDRVFGADNNAALLSNLGGQITPRFWDWYHIGMTPSAEQVPRDTIARKGGVTVYKIPPQLVTAPSIIETGTRENRHAQMVPNHAFSCIIRTMGPKKNNYIPTTPVEVQIGRNTNEGNDDDRLRLSWSIPLSTQYQAINENLILPEEANDEDVEGSFPTCDYKWQPLRQVATTSYGGNVQDPEISDIRKKLYEQVVKEGWKPKLDQNGKPKFFFWQNNVKACYIKDGFGMCVYEWRPKLADSNEVGIELMVD